MLLKCLAPSDTWDNPIFKRLANNDTGASTGNQAGILVPIDLRAYFPGLVDSTSAENPTTSIRIDVELLDSNIYLGSAHSRYQFQTWGGTRKPESRLTDRLGPIRNIATGGDYLIIRRDWHSLHHYQLTLIRQSSPNYVAIAALAGSRRWGVLQDEAPIRDTDLTAALDDEHIQEAGEFQLFDDTATTTLSNVVRVSRLLAFRLSILALYGDTCSVCGQALRHPEGYSELEAAHVVPRSILGTNDARNGLALCKRHHWAFDKGLIGVSDSRLVLVPATVKAIGVNQSLTTIEGKLINEASKENLRVHVDAFRWHRENILLN